VGNNAFVSLGAVLINDISDGERVAGNFAYDTKKFMKEFKMKKSEE
jgi:acetyltransferase-like isoleucine patch superfamily enzyme